ncbi:MAG: FAD-dependent oxidoreductase [Saprospiraceae bacterium]|nr:FAD-dependent oxidoreductase [Saprospiraceae bacterium]
MSWEGKKYHHHPQHPDKRTRRCQEKGTKIQSIFLDSGKEITAEVFIDASVEGHLIHLAGVTTETIREGKINTENLKMASSEKIITVILWCPSIHINPYCKLGVF